MHRRAIVTLLARTIAGACAAVVGLPGVRYLWETASRHEETESANQRLLRLKDLPVGRPLQMAVSGRRRDAWTVYPQETIGRVWLVRETSAGEDRVVAFTSICPHLGCAVKIDGAANQFVCPCHKAAWNLTGKKLDEKQLGHPNPSPRDLDRLECAIVPDEATGEAWIEVRYQKFKHGLTVQVEQA